MPVVALNYERLVPLIGKISKKEIKKMFSDLGLDIEDNKKINVESLIKEVLPYLGLDIEHEDEEKIRVEYSPNRPDYSTETGIALGLQGLLGLTIGAIKLKIKKSKQYTISVKSDVSKVRPFVTGIVAKNGELDSHDIEQLMQMQEDLHNGIGRKRKKSSIGIHDLDKIQFPLVYTTTDRKHKFNPGKIESRKIVCS